MVVKLFISVHSIFFSLKIIVFKDSKKKKGSEERRRGKKTLSKNNF